MNCEGRHNSLFQFPFLFALLGISLVSNARGEVILPLLLTNHMVVQRNLPVHVWGLAGPGESVSVTFRSRTRSVAADALGHWSVLLPPCEPGGPFQMTISGKNTIVLQDILVGDVWVASGQSNMEFALRETLNAEAEIAASRHPRIRIFRVQHKASDSPLQNLAGGAWNVCTPETVADSSAVAYFFARDLYRKIRVPIGLLESTWGATTVESWTSRAALSADASTPALVYNGMISPLMRFPIRGVIWYQGESNTGPERAALYARLFQTMIRDWRSGWGEGEFPFLFVQLASRNAPALDQWATVREAQREALRLKNTGMVVTIDLANGEDLHPKDKQDVGLRLALAARAVAYGERIEASGPLFRRLSHEDPAIRVWFDHAAGGLVAKGTGVKGFEIAGADHKFLPAAAIIDGTSVVISNPLVDVPVYIRYGWASNPNCNLYNHAGLPASPFQPSD